MPQHDYELYTPLLMEILKRRFMGSASTPQPSGIAPIGGRDPFTDEPQLDLSALMGSANEQPDMFDRGRPPPMGSTAYWAENPPPSYDPSTSLYEVPERTAAGGYVQRGKPSSPLRTLKDLQRAANELKGVPPQVASEVLMRLLGYNVAKGDPELQRALAQIMLRHELEEPGRKEARQVSKERAAEAKTAGEAQREYQKEILELRRKEGEGRQLGRMKQIGDAMQAVDLRAADLKKLYGDERYQQLRQQLSQMYLMALIQGLSGDLPEAKVTRRK